MYLDAADMNRPSSTISEGRLECDSHWAVRRQANAALELLANDKPFSGTVPAGILNPDLTACVMHGWDAYFAYRDGGIRKLHLRPYRQGSKLPGFEGDSEEEPTFWQASREVTLESSAGAKTFVSLYVDRLPGVNVVLIYGVARDAFVYRFSEDGVPDRRVAFDPHSFGSNK